MMTKRIHNTKQSWRNQQRIQFLKNFYAARQMIEKFYQQFLDNQSISSDTIDTLIEQYLRNLKKLSQSLYQVQDDEAVERKKQRLFDKLIGELFHELGKTRDNIRLVDAHEEDAEEHNDEFWRSLTRFGGQVISTARREIPLQVGRSVLIMNKLVPLFEQILPIYRDNEIVLRTIYLSRNYFDPLTKPSTIEYFFPILYGSVDEGYRSLIHSFLQTRHIDNAQVVLQEFRHWAKSNGHKPNPALEQAEAEFSGYIT